MKLDIGGQFYAGDLPVPTGDFKNEWSLFEKVKGEKVKGEKVKGEKVKGEKDTKGGTAKGVEAPML